MKKIFRASGTKDYWETRWHDSGVDEREFENLDMYPVKYSDPLVKNANNILEAGCGAGRVYFHYKKAGKNIKAFDYSENAVSNIIDYQPDANVIVADITNLPYSDGEFDLVMAFGVFHGIDSYDDILRGLSECSRVMANNGKLIFSVRQNSLENDIVEYKAKEALICKAGGGGGEL